MAPFAPIITWCLAVNFCEIHDFHGRFYLNFVIFHSNIGHFQCPDFCLRIKLLRHNFPVTNVPLSRFCFTIESKCHGKSNFRVVRKKHISGSSEKSIFQGFQGHWAKYHMKLRVFKVHQTNLRVFRVRQTPSTAYTNTFFLLGNFMKITCHQ